MINLYKSFNSIIDYIENNLEQKIDYKIMARQLGTNVGTMRKIFIMLTNNSPAEYIRKRRLSNAGVDLVQYGLNISCVATKYQYNNITSFSRAFNKFHGVNPSLVRKDTKLKIFPKIHFEEKDVSVPELEYEVVELGDLDLYGIGIDTDNSRIITDAPRFFKDTNHEYQKLCGKIKYGVTTYDKNHKQCQRYYCLYDKKCPGFENVKICKSKWLKFRIYSQKTADIQKTVYDFYHVFLPSAQYELKQSPEIECYYNGVTDFLVAIN